MIKNPIVELLKSIQDNLLSVNNLLKEQDRRITNIETYLGKEAFDMLVAAAAAEDPSDE